jgi:hypothetical protein
LVCVKVGQGRPKEAKSARLYRVLVGHDHHVAVRVLSVETPGNLGDTAGDIVEALVGEREILGMIEIGLELTGKTDRNVPPGVTLPTAHEGPLGQIRVDLDRHRGSGRNRLCGPQGTLQGRAPDGYHRAGTEVATDTPGLFNAVGGQAKSGKTGVYEMIGIIDLAVPDQVNENCHVGQFGRSRPVSEVTSTGCGPNPSSMSTWIPSLSR